MGSSAKPDSPLFDVARLPQARRYWVGFSGGADSTALLHVLSHDPRTKDRVHALHINHRLQAQSDAWAAHCSEQCRAWGVPLHIETLQLPDDSENTARTARQACFREHLKSGDVLLLGHHARDRIETVLFNWLRGSGLNGLSGMAERRGFASGLLARPLFACTPEQIRAHLRDHAVDWIEDPSNATLRHRRNRIRHTLLPVLREINAGAEQNIARGADNLAASQDLLAALIPACNPLPLATLLALPAGARVAYLQHWLLHFVPRLPEQRQMAAFVDSLPDEGQCNHAQLRVEGWVVQHWRGGVYALHAPRAVPTESFDWDARAPLRLGESRQSMRMDVAGGDDSAVPRWDVRVRFGCRGEAILLPGRSTHQRVKKLLQAAALPPWVRAQLPFVFAADDGALLAVGDVLHSARLHEWQQRHGLRLTWQRPEWRLRPRSEADAASADNDGL